ncbi:VOC family protein [Kurthia huakuii]|uniref:VOC family protein n=1 Tax=Kurthia huakuii TaxID=1421019 RepID=UPI000495D00D|nr:VOC family protein [Kurthia huakuii]
MHHHISMITKNANTNNHFYRHILGLRRVKLTVNQDDPHMYHLFYGDTTGTPGTNITFFEMKIAGATRRGTNAITGFSLIVPSVESLTFWQQRFAQLGVKHGDITTYAGRQALPFEDEDGLRMHLIVADERESFWEPWPQAAIPTEHLIQGMGTVEMTVRDEAALATTLTEIFDYTAQQGHVYQQQAGSAVGEIFVIEQAGDREKPGRGSIHHIALRVNDVAELEHVLVQARAHGFKSEGIIDRYFFHSIYFREANGILIEVATDGPGFTIDENIEQMGEALDLPPFLEQRRPEIEQKLTVIEEEL